jgi:predicted DNA-binding protein (MmcQ/YjbR family)
VPEDPRLVQLSEICLGLPEASRELSPPHATFRVRKKTFAYYLDNHRGDEGIVGLACKAPAGENEALTAEDPARIYIPAYVGPRGWLGFRLDTPDVDWDRVEDLVVRSYLLTAPRRLGALLTSR